MSIQRTSQVNSPSISRRSTLKTIGMRRATPQSCEDLDRCAPILTERREKINLKMKLKLLQGDHTMKTVSMLDFRQGADAIIERVRRGERLVLTYRGKPAIRLEPIVEETLRKGPFLRAESPGRS